LLAEAPATTPTGAPMTFQKWQREGLGGVVVVLVEVAMQYFVSKVVVQ